MQAFVCSDTEVESDGGGSRCKQAKNKPLMEKKRRARINKSLTALKQILVQDGHRNSAQHAKWEKADILEMTVEYLQQMRSAQSCFSSPSTSSIPTPIQTSTPPEEKTVNVPTSPMIPLVNPIMQQYMAYHQLAQLSMYSQIMGNPLGLLQSQVSSDSDQEKRV